MNERVVKHYDALLYSKFADEYYENSGFANFGFWDEHTTGVKQACCNLLEKLLSFIPEKQGTILDVACGKGGSTGYLLNYYPSANITAINISEKQIETARKNVPDCTFITMDAVGMNFEDNSFDNLLCAEAAFHFNTRERFLKGALRILKPGGRLVLSDVLMQAGAEKRMRTFHKENYIANPDGYGDLCRQAGFSEVEVVDATQPCWEGHYWNMIRHFHAKYLSRDIDMETLKAILDNTYKIAAALRWYLLVSLRKDPA